YFAAGGYRNILYAVAVVPSKLQRIDQIQKVTGARIFLVIDSVEGARAIAHRSHGLATSLACLVEVDCGEHRGGVVPVAEAVLPVARALAESERITVEGVMSHAGHSYLSGERRVIEEIAENERRSAVEAAQILRMAGFACPIVSIGSTPTILFARHL